MEEEEVEIKYGIRHVDGKIIAITEFLEGKVLEGFVEITKADYERFLTALRANPYSTYNAETNELIPDSGKLIQAQIAKERDKLRKNMRELSVEIELMVKLTEDTTDRQSEFDALKVQYDSLKPS